MVYGINGVPPALCILKLDIITKNYYTEYYCNRDLF